MKIKVGTKIYNLKDEPILFIFDDRNEIDVLSRNLKNMVDGSLKLLSFESGTLTEQQIQEFMNIEKDD